MNQAANIYGFGSYFKIHAPPPNDIDLLVVHQDVSVDSISLALQCKAVLTKILPEAHITILSKEEERELEFLRRSQAALLNTVNSSNVSSTISELAKSLRPSRTADACSYPVPSLSVSDVHEGHVWNLE